MKFKKSLKNQMENKNIQIKDNNKKIWKYKEIYKMFSITKTHFKTKILIF